MTTMLRLHQRGGQTKLAAIFIISLHISTGTKQNNSNLIQGTHDGGGGE